LGCAAASAQSSIHSYQQLHAPEIEYKAPPEARKRGAMIGAAAKLNPEGVQIAAREARARELHLKRLVPFPPPPQHTHPVFLELQN
jgi:hypothetical protein